jgi:serine acetyltransferase
MASCSISGEVTYQNGVYCGTRVKVVNQLFIGEYAIIGTGAEVTRMCQIM